MAIEDIVKNQWAAVAAQKARSQNPEELVMTMSAMRKHYSQFGLENDPIINEVFAEAQTGLQTGNITSAGLMRAIGFYGQQFGASIASSTFNDLISYSGYHMPEDVSQAVAQYGDMIVSDIEDDAVKQAVSVLTGHKINTQLMPQLYNELTDIQINGLFQAPEPEAPTPVTAA